MAAIEFRNVSKRYLIPDGTGQPAGARLSTPARLLRLLRTPRRECWALRDVSFSVEQGTAVALIGANGAGKSTALKLLARVTSPTHGRVVARGRVSALLELGTGFHPELTGRENIYLYGSILGMRRSNIGRKLDQIVDFAGIAPFLDVPLKRYSSGMTVRLGFAVAVHTDPEILLVDEVLAVGDDLFRDKSINTIRELMRRGVTMLVVSHNRQMIEGLCRRAVVLHGGHVIADDSTARAFQAYQRAAQSLDGVPNRMRNLRATASPVQVTGATLVGTDGRERSEFRPLETLRMRMRVVATESVGDVRAFCAIRRGWETVHRTESEPFSVRARDTLVLEISYQALPLSCGSYAFDVGLRSAANAIAPPYDRWNQILPFSVIGSTGGEGFISLLHDWRVDRELDSEAAMAP